MRVNRHLAGCLLGLLLGNGILASDAVKSWTIEDTAGVEHRLPNASEFKATVLIFLQTDCPISNQYAPALARLNREFSSRQVRFFRVYPDRHATREEVGKHTKDYHYAMPAILDPQHVLARRTGATITPEAVVFDGAGRQVYRGRINNRYVDFGKKRPRATRQDLRLALEAVLDGRNPEEAVTQAIGCYIQTADRE